MKRFIALLLIAAAACNSRPQPLAISLVTDARTRASVVRVTGLSSSELSSIRHAQLTDDQWPALMRVAVASGPADAPPMAGLYEITGDGIVFTPRFPFDPGRNYVVDFDPSRLPTPRAGSTMRQVVGLPAVVRTPSTTVVRMLPSADVLPENLLRVYFEFSARMSRENGRDYLRLLDEGGHEIKDAFLSLDIEFWSPDYRRYTLLFDPGRVKRGILPNEQFGRALRAGHRYTIEVDRRWADADGQPMAAPFRRVFTAGPADMQPINIADWSVKPPRAGTREPLVVGFTKALDHGLLQRAIGVARAGQPETIGGDITIGPDQREWRFTPQTEWRAGTFDLVVLGILEDPCGNRIDRAFDVDRFTQIDPTPAPERRTRSFVIR